MKARTIREMIKAKGNLEQGRVAPASVWKIEQKAKGVYSRRAMDTQAFQRAQQTTWKKSVPRTRLGLGLSQADFAKLLGISVRTLHHWEQGTRAPSGAARVLLRVAARHPKILLESAV